MPKGESLSTQLSFGLTKDEGVYEANWARATQAIEKEMYKKENFKILGHRIGHSIRALAKLQDWFVTRIIANVVPFQLYAV